MKEIVTVICKLLSGELKVFYLRAEISSGYFYFLSYFPFFVSPFSISFTRWNLHFFGFFYCSRFSFLCDLVFSFYLIFSFPKYIFCDQCIPDFSWKTTHLMAFSTYSYYKVNFRLDFWFSGPANLSLWVLLKKFGGRLKRFHVPVTTKTWRFERPLTDTMHRLHLLTPFPKAVILARSLSPIY